MSYICCITFFFFSSRRRHTRYWRDWSSDVCSSDLTARDRPHDRGECFMTATPAGGAAVDALLAPDFLADVATRSMADVRRLRRQAEQEEVNLSYTRRLLQGRLDIVRSEEHTSELQSRQY